MVRPQINSTILVADLTYTQQTVAADVMPAGIGCLATYAEKHGVLSKPIGLFKYPEAFAKALNASQDYSVVGLSNYVWNGSLAYRFAQAIKRRHPRVAIIFGGPNYPLDPKEQEDWLRAHPAVDFYVVKEGEIAFLRLIEALEEAQGDIEAVKRRGIPSVHAVGADGTAYLTPLGERVTNLDDIPSPYSTGRLDEFFDGVLLPIIQTNRGCPFTCTFCVEGDGFFSKVYRNSALKITDELDYIGRRMQEVRGKGGRNDLFIADSNFGMYANDLETCRTLAKTRVDYGWPEYINVATGKNQKERVLEASRLIDGAMRLSGSVQSLTPEVLENIKRKNISPADIMELGLKANEVGANSYSEIIMALPGETRQTHFDTIRTVMDAGFTNLFLFQLMMLPGTELASAATRERFAMQGRFRVLPRCYGRYDVCGQEAVAAEIEEICVSTDRFSFDDYVASRRFHLLVTVFYNDAVFGTLLKLLRGLGLSVFRWMEMLAEIPMGPALAEIFGQFEQATRGELWESRQELEEFTRQPGIIERYVSGELGNNLLFVHKTLAITTAVGELSDLARAATLRVLAEAGQDGGELAAFIDDALIYHQERMRDLFGDLDARPLANLSFDIKRFDEERAPGPVAGYRFAGPRNIEFYLDDAQKELIRRNLGLYGSTPVGIGRILSKVYVRRILRHASIVST